MKLPPFKQFLANLNIPREEWEDGALDLPNTAERVDKMFRQELLKSYLPGALDSLNESVTLFPSDGGDAMVLEGPIDFHSTCAHHLLPFSGEAYVGYIPKDYLIGASKIPRIVEYFSRMLQIQERLARQTADYVFSASEARLVIVLMRAAHSCMRCRGVKQQRTTMVTTAIVPSPRVWTSEDERKNRGVLDEFYSQLNLITR